MNTGVQLLKHLVIAVPLLDIYEETTARQLEWQKSWGNPQTALTCLLIHSLFMYFNMHFCNFIWYVYSLSTIKGFKVPFTSLHSEHPPPSLRPEEVKVGDLIT